MVVVSGGQNFSHTKLFVNVRSFFDRVTNTGFFIYFNQIMNYKYTTHVPRSLDNLSKSTLLDSFFLSETTPLNGKEGSSLTDM